MTGFLLAFSRIRAADRLSPLDALAWSLVPLGVLDTALLLLRYVTVTPRASFWLALYLVGQRAAVAAVFGLVVLAASRLPRKIVWGTLPLLFGAAYVMLSFLYREDLMNQTPERRVQIALGTAILPVALVGARLFLPWHWLVRAPILLFGFALALANHRLLRLNYPGFHVACVVLSTLAVAVALQGKHAVARPLGRERLAVSAAVLLLALLALFVPPPARASGLLVTEDALALYRFSARYFQGGASGPSGQVDNPYFRSRAKAPSIPAGPPVIEREQLLVMLITVDALRFDAISGERAGRFPTLTAIAAESTSFTNANTPAVSTTGTMVALFTGQYQPQMRWREASGGRKAHIPELATKRFPEYLTRAGVNSFVAVTNFRLMRSFKAAVGFETEWKPKVRGYPNADDVLPKLGDWMLKHSDGPSFAHVHLVDAHRPYDRAGTHGSEFERYLRELELVDRDLGKLIQTLKDGGIWDRTLLILSADHGEAFGEHGQYAHNGWLYQELTHVPLFLRIPGRKAQVVSEPVSIIDLGPTLLDLFGRPTPGVFMGQSLVPFLRGERPKLERPVAIHDKKGQGAIVFPDLIKAMYIPELKQAEVYDLKRDPKELDNLASEPWARERIDAVRRFFDAHEVEKPGIW